MPRRILEGKVVSDKMDKTITVLVERRYMHPVYKKYIRKSDKYAAHDETNAFRTGDRVQIEECRPISKRKSWKVVTVPTREGSVRAESVTEKKSSAPKVAKKSTTAADKKTMTAKPVAKKPAAKKGEPS